jgi:hypothetical protein
MNRPFVTSLCLLALAATASTATAGEFAATPPGWELYVHEPYGSEIALPSDRFTSQPSLGEGRRFVSEEAVVELFTFGRDADESPATLRDALLKLPGYDHVTRGVVGRHSLLISGIREDDIFVEKYLFRHRFVHVLGIQFPVEAEAKYSRILPEIEGSFRAYRAMRSERMHQIGDANDDARVIY